MPQQRFFEMIGKRKLFALLIDPDKHDEKTLSETVIMADKCKTDILLVGGSLISVQLESTIVILKKHTNIPVFLFPGSCIQLSDKADGILLLSLISGRNPDFLIGNHVIAAPLIKKSRLEIVPTGYILINGSRTSSTEYISNTIPIPAEKQDIINATAQAGEMLGLKVIYLEAGSGAEKPVSENTIMTLKSSISLPLIVGGGIHSPSDLNSIYRAGANMAVVGTAIEKILIFCRK